MILPIRRFFAERDHEAVQGCPEKTGETKFQDVAKVLLSGETETKNIRLNALKLARPVRCLAP